MPHRSSTLTDLASMSGLHPVLQAALDSLDVELEEELVRYRRQRYRQAKQVEPQIPIWQPVMAGAAQSNASTRSPQLPFASGTSVQNVISRLQQGSTTSDVHPGSHAGVNVHPPTVQPPIDHPSVAMPAPAQTHPAVALDMDIDREIATPSERFKAASPSSYPATPDLQNEMALATVPPDPDWEELMAADDPDPIATDSIATSPEPDFSAAPDDYLQSSEDLLRSIAEESAARRSRQEATLLDSLLTPLGVGSMALVLLSSASLSYVIMHPSSLDFLWSQEQASHSHSADTNPETFASPLIPDSPNLAADEFVDLNVNNLSTVPGTAARSPLPSPNAVQPSPTTTVAPTPTAIDAAPVVEEVPAEIESPDPLPVAEPDVEPEPISEPANVAPDLPIVDSSEPSAPASAPADIATAPMPPEPIGTESNLDTSATQPTGTYYVVTPYSGDPSLQQAREAVPDAYVRNFASGASVQLGVFSDQENAQELLQQLQAEGISAEIYQP